MNNIQQLIGSLQKQLPSPVEKLSSDSIGHYKGLIVSNLTPPYIKLESLVQRIKTILTATLFKTPAASIQSSQGKTEEDTTTYLDAHKLLKGMPGDRPISPEHQAWYLHQANLLSHAENADKDTQQSLHLALLHGYSKAATVAEDQSKELGIQSSPFMAQDYRYHRSTSNSLLSKVNTAYANDMGFKEHEALLIDSPLLSEVFTRELVHKDGEDREIDFNIDSAEKFDEAFEKILAEALPNPQGSLREVQQAVFDISELVRKMQNPNNPAELRELVSKLETQLLNRVAKLCSDRPHIPQDDVSRLLAKMQVVAYLKHPANVDPKKQ